MLDITSQKLVSNIRIGWNLGHSLEACVSDLDGDSLPDVTLPSGQKPDETLWGNPPVSEQLFKTLVDSGINAVRIPITWREHIDEDFNIEEDWLNRVKQVVDYAYNCGMYVIITLYHDGAADTDLGAWLRNAQEDYDKAVARYKHLWEQIADNFYMYNEKLLYESMNEVEFSGVSSDEAYDLLNRINQEFVDTVRGTGRNNMRRHLVISGYNADINATCDRRFKMPDDREGKLILSLHYYTPDDLSVDGQNDTWGTPNEQRLMESHIDTVAKTFVENGIPVMLTEYGANGVEDTAGSVFFCEKLAKLCHDSGIAAFLWDDGGGIDRETLEWRTPELIAALNRASGGESYIPKKMEISD